MSLDAHRRLDRADNHPTATDELCQRLKVMIDDLDESDDSDDRATRMALGSIRAVLRLILPRTFLIDASIKLVDVIGGGGDFRNPVVHWMTMLIPCMSSLQGFAGNWRIKVIHNLICQVHADGDSIGIERCSRLLALTRTILAASSASDLVESLKGCEKLHLLMEGVHSDAYRDEASWRDNAVVVNGEFTARDAGGEYGRY